MRALIFSFFLLIHCYCIAQGPPPGKDPAAVIDSLAAKLKTAAADTNRVNLLNELLKNCVLVNSYDKAEMYGLEALDLSKKLGFDRGLSRSYNGLGNIFREQGNYSRSLDYYLLGLQLNEKLGDTLSAAINMGNLGIIYKNEKEYVKALDYFSRSLVIFEKRHDQLRMSSVLNNLGTLYWTMSEEKKSGIEEKKKYYDRALHFYFRALEIDEKLKQKNNISIRMGNIASIYKGMSDMSKDAKVHDSLLVMALDYYDKALAVNGERERKSNVAIWLGNIANIYTSQKKYSESEKLFLRAIALTDSMGLLQQKSNFCYNISDLYRILGQYQKSLDYYKIYSQARDSIFNQDKNKEMLRNEMNYEYAKKEAELKAQQEKKETLAKEENKRQSLLLLLVATIAVAVGIIAFIAFRTLRITRSQKRIIESQKEVVEMKQKEVLDSIHYAKRIQQSLMPSERYIERILEKLKKK